MGTIINFISEHYPVIALIFALLGVAVVATFKAAMYHVSIQKTRQKVDELPCDAHSSAIGNIEKVFAEKIGSLPCDVHNHKIVNQDKTIVGHGEVINDISVWIMKKDKSMIPLFMSKHSPYYLNPTGIALLEASGGKKCIDENIDFFISRLEDVNPTTPYDVEEKAMGVIIGSKGLPLFNPIKNYIYFQPDIVELAGEKVEISIFATASVMGIYLRDIYLAKHPEVLIENSYSY